MIYDSLIDNSIFYQVVERLGYGITLDSLYVWGPSPCCDLEDNSLCIDVVNRKYECTTCGSTGDCITLVCKHLYKDRKKAAEWITQSFDCADIVLLST